MKFLSGNRLTSTSAIILAAVFNLSTAFAASPQKEAESSIIPKLKFQRKTPSDVLTAISCVTGIEVFYTPTKDDQPNLSVALTNIPASEAFKYVAGLTNLKITYKDDGVHLEGTGQPQSGSPVHTVPIEDQAQQHMAKKMDEIAQTTRLKAGDKAPDFTCRTTSGEEFSLGKEKGKVVLINFFATWCSPCMAEMPHLDKEIYQRHAGRGDFKVIALGIDLQAAELAKFEKNKGFSLPMAADPKQEIYGKYAEKSIPRTFIIGRDGKVKLASGGYTEERFQEVVQALQKELDAK